MLEIRLVPLAIFISSVFAEFANFGTVPKGENPTLYDAQNDQIIQLDETTFNETVYCRGRTDCTGYLVEFYSDWCGHCRAYAPLYKNLGKDVQTWKNVAKVSAMNCADSLNEATCRANGVMFFPFIKYFPRHSNNSEDGYKLKTLQSVSLMREQFSKMIQSDYEQNKHPDWPNLTPLQPIATYSELFSGIDESVKFIALIFENDAASMLGTQFVLDLTEYKQQIAARKVQKGHPLTEALHIIDYPTVAIFKRGEHEPILQTELKRLFLFEIETFLRNDSGLKGIHFSSHPQKSNRTQQFASDSGEQEGTTKAPIQNDCDKDPERCKTLYYVSESDMLKALRYALVREVSRNGGNLSGQNLTGLYNFVDTLAEHFPHTTIDVNENGTQKFLNASSRARVVFTHMRDFIKNNGLENPLPVDSWKEEFLRAEDDQGKPFPTSGDWQHCKGSAPQYRGYTCGLWTTFHALTVHSYQNSVNSSDFNPKDVLKSIRGWVGSFFGCEHCKQHFLKMTGKTFDMEKHINKPEDAYLYLWKAHNIVNARLKGRDTEDPEYPKRQFPGKFLCENCQTEEKWDEEKAKDYLINYYTKIRPLISS